MKSKTKNQTQAFTIIEVVLVLAVAGLIFLIVFQALPRLQASRRDNARKRDAELMVSAIIDHASNIGRLPTKPELASAISGSGGLADYMQGFKDPSTGQAYTVVNAATPSDGQINYAPAWLCNSSRTAIESTPGASGQGGFIIGLERGTYCLDASL